MLIFEQIKETTYCGLVSEYRQTPFPKELLEKKGFFYLLISIFSYKFERRTQYIDVLNGVGSVTIICKYAPPINLASTFGPNGKIVSHRSGNHWCGATD
ncbi:hypothetical protein ACQJ0Y_23880 [Peribacillus simplex]|uniref:hypothetical protein n=1 Tax=Peribacillus simplex TaxID=1478 RepID=UPI003CEF15B4